MGIALLGIALWAYLGVQHTLREQLDRSLRITFELQSLDLAGNDRITSATVPMEENRFVRELNRLIVVRDSSGRILQANSDLALDLALDSAGFRRAMAGRRSMGYGTWRGRGVRSVYGATPAGAPAPAAVLQVAASLGPLEAASRTVLLRMIATALLGALASFVGAGWLARSALAPVEEIATQAKAVQGTGQRITAHANVSELQGLIEILNQMLGRLERSYQWHRRIIRDLSHDLRTPITTMRAGVEVALWSERKPDEYRQVLASTLEEIDRLVLIGDALSLLARLESGDVAPVLTSVDLRLLASQAVDRARARVGEQTVHLAPPPTALPARVDARLLGMALDQLLDNARLHTPPGTPVEVAAGALDGGVTLTVEDHGPGVPDEMMPHLFDRFYRGDAARGRHAGFGLGLSVAAAIVNLHRGRIAAERGAAGGLRIRIELPASAATPTPRPPPSDPSPGG
jgi:two-component system heavy metal sensor histidine kinase CusS